VAFYRASQGNAMPTIKLFRRHDLKDAPLIALAGLGVGIFASILVGALV